MTESNIRPIKVGSRKSELALIQTKHVISQLQKLYPEKCFEIHTMSTIGDRVLNVSLPKIGEKSLFTRDLEDALRNGGVDFVVHSLKDLPTVLPAGMVIGAVLQREDSRDALVLNEKYKGQTIDTLPDGSVIGTSSLRRTAQLKRLYPHLEICDIRGNLNTRLAKLDALNSKFAGIILAQAGLMRMGWTNRISQTLEPNHLLYAVGQGALAVECRLNDEKILNMLENLMCLTTTCRIIAERSFLKTLGGGCSAPVAVKTEINENFNDYELHLDITGAVWSLDGSKELKEDIDCCIKLDNKRKKIEKEEKSEDTTSKKLKLDNENNNDNIEYKNIADNTSDLCNNKVESNENQKSPKIINDDKLSESNESKVPDLEHLINVHGELFKKCPFYAQHQKDRETGNTSTKKDECPLNIPIGQDFMGKCPYVDLSKKIELSEKFGNLCPVTQNFFSDSNNRNSKKIDILSQGDTGALNISKCPFLSQEKNVQNSIKNALVEEENKIGHEICPFIQKNVKMFNYDEEKLKFKDDLPQQQFLTGDSNEKFCGLYCHKSHKYELFSKCEQIGKKLAENLIKQGALVIMKCAQQEIRGQL